MSQLNVDTIKKADGTGNLSVPAETGTVVTTASPSLGRRNLIINGAMQVAQRGTSFTSGAAIYTLDRWKSQARAGASVTTTKEADQLVDGTSFGVLQHNVTTAASDGLTLLNQFIENGSQDLYGQQVTLSWYARVTSGSATIQPVYEMNSETSDTGDTETLTSDWQRFTYTTTLTGYTYPATTYEHLRLSFYIRDNSAHTVQITGVQLEVGTVATPFEHRSYGEELALCQRYFYYFDPSTTTVLAGTRGGSSTVICTIPTPVTMRSQPTFSSTDVTAFQARGGNASGAASNTQIVGYAGNMLSMQLTVGFVPSATYAFTVYATSAGNHSFDAEL